MSTTEYNFKYMYRKQGIIWYFLREDFGPDNKYARVGGEHKSWMALVDGKIAFF